LDPRQRLTLAIALPLHNQKNLTDLLRQLYDPASPDYRRFLTPAQFTARFGPTEQDYRTVERFAATHGLTVTYRHSNRLLLDVNGTVADVEKTLHVTMRVYQHPTEKRNFYAPDTEPSLDLAVPISHIAGLDNYELPKPNFHRLPVARAAVARPSTGSGPSGNYIGNDFRAAYVPGVALTGSGQTVAMLEFDGYAAADITYYENLAGLPNVSLSNVLLENFNGTPTNVENQTEVSLDIEMDISMAPGASQIIVYEAGPNGIFDDILNRMVSDDLAKQLSSSWSVTERRDDPTADYDFEEMAAQGQSFFQASGDSDAYTGTLPFPCDNPFITVVGGTTLTDNGAGGSWSSETAWNWGYDSSARGYIGTSGGVSTRYSIPSWQKGISMTANKGSTSKRNVPDVALTADNVYVRVNGSDTDVGGTSCAAPLWAAFIALVNQQAIASGESPVGFINPAIYAIGTSSAYSTDFHDITTGNNFSNSSPSKFPAVTGYDLCTGWGTPAGAALINALAPLPTGMQTSNLQVSSSGAFSSSGTAGGPFTPDAYAYGLTNAGSSSMPWSASATQTWLSLSATSGTLAASGSSTVTASINANANALTSGTYFDAITFTDLATGDTQTEPVSLTVIPAPYAAWQSQVFTPAQLADPTISGDTADPAGDGIPNLMKYALALNPFTNGIGGLPVGSIATTGSGNYLTLTYTQVISATDITYNVQVSTDLQTWNSGPGYTATVSSTDNPGGLTETVTVQALTPVTPANPKLFIQLQVTGP